MPASLAATITGSVAWGYTSALAGGITSQNQGSFSAQVGLTNGTGLAGTSDLIYAAQLTLAGGASSNVDLAGGTADLLGTTFTMVRVKALFVQLTTLTAAASILIGNGTNPWINWISPSTGALKVFNGGFVILATPDATAYPVTAATGDILKIFNNDGAITATVNIAVIGSSA